MYGRCDPCHHEDPGQEDRGARDCPGPLYPRSGKRPPAIQRTCDDTSAGRHKDPPTASTGRPYGEV